MSAWSTIMDTILGAGTFTRHGSQPTTIILYSGSVRVRGTYILLEDQGEEPTQDHQNKVLFKKKMGLITIFAPNYTTRDNIEADIEDIIKDCSYGVEILSTNPSIPQKNQFKYELLVEILD